MNQGFGYVGQQENGYYQAQAAPAGQWPAMSQQQVVWGGSSNEGVSYSSGGGDSMYNQMQMSDDGQPITTVYVANDNVKRLIGKGGSRIRELEEQTNAKIKVMKDGASDGHTPVELRGNPEAREEARQTIEHMFDSFQISGGRNDGGGGGGGGGGFGGGWQGGDQSSTIYVPVNKVGRLIGRGGSRIREIQETTGAFVKIRKENEEDGMVPTELRGSDDSREEARRVIQQLCDSDGPQQYGGYQGGDDYQSRGGGGNGFGGGWSQGGGDEVTICYVSEGQVGKLIGRGGSNIRAIQDNSGAKIKVKKENMEDGKVPVELRGMKDAREEARRTIEQLFEDDGSYGGGMQNTMW